MIRTRPRPTGITMIEMLTASVVAGALIAFVAQLLVAAVAQQQAAGSRMLATAELANVAEHIAPTKYDEVTVESLERIELSPAVAESFEKARLTFDVHDEAGPPAGKRIDIALRWHNRAGEPSRLTTWKFAPGEGSP